MSAADVRLSAKQARKSASASLKCRVFDRVQEKLTNNSEDLRFLRELWMQLVLLAPSVPWARTCWIIDMQFLHGEIHHMQLLGEIALRLHPTLVYPHFLLLNLQQTFLIPFILCCVLYLLILARLIASICALFSELN